MPPDRLGNAAKRVAIATPGPWKQWRTRSRYARAVRFIETYCRTPKGVGFGKPLKLAPFQKAFLKAALANGVDDAILATPRGNGKSSFGGAIAVWALFDDDEWGAPQVPVVATTIGQAIRSCYGVAVSMIKAEPELLKRALIYTGVATPRVVIPYNNGELFPIANDVDGLQGLDPSFALVDEIGFQPQDAWDSLRMASGKRPRSLVVGVGTPGLDRDNALFRLRRIVTEGETPAGLVFHEFTAPLDAPLEDEATWRQANPAINAGFLRISALTNDLALTPEGHFRIFRLGQWVDGVDSWLGPNARMIWDGIEAPFDFLPGAPTWVGVDVGLKRDSTAVVAIQRDSDGVLHALSRFWLPTDDRPVDVTDVMEYIRELDRAYQLEAVSYDPRFFDVPAKMLTDEGLPLIEIPQSVERMTGICGTLFELVKGGRTLRHDGDETLGVHVLNAIPRFNERGFTLAKNKSRGRIDGVIALALAVDRALHPVEVEPVVKPKFYAFSQPEEPVAAWAD